MRCHPVPSSARTATLAMPRRVALALVALVLLAALPALADGFPRTIRHAYGETLVPGQPLRVVSVGYHEQDFLYALGIAPVGVHQWMGDPPHATWDWAELARAALDARPEVQRGFEIDVEWVYLQQPDLIVATFAPMDADTYALLSRIAPVVAAPEGYPAWGAPWEAELRLIGAATGRTDRAEAVIAALDARIAATAAAHPELAGLSGTTAYFSEGQIVGYRRSDGANRLLARLGIGTPASFDALAGPGGNFMVSPERADLFDLDVVLWLGDDPSRARIEALPSYRATRLAREGRSIWTDQLMVNALSFQSPLSIDWALDRLAAALAEAADGVPQGQAPDSR